jgi:hypothetical protein
MHIVKSEQKITEQIDALCRHYKFNTDVYNCMKQIAYNAYLKGVKTVEIKLTPHKNINKL